jgi:hypothetical protein
MYKSYKALSAVPTSEPPYGSQFDVYSDLWVESMWNNYRSVRLLIYEHIMSSTLKYGSSNDKSLLQTAKVVLREMADGVCQSVPFHLCCCRDVNQVIQMNATIPKGAAIPGGYLLMWPLYLSGMLRTTPRNQRKWIADKMRRIGMHMGVRLAMSMAELLQQDDKSFSDSGVWFIGEWYPL